MGINFALCGISEDEAWETVQAIFDSVHRLALGSAPFEQFACRADDDYVVAELQRRQARLAAQGQHDDTITTWQEKTGVFLQEKGLRWSSCAAPPDHIDSPWFALLSERQRVLLGCLLQTNPHAFAYDLSLVFTRFDAA